MCILCMCVVRETVKALAMSSGFEQWERRLSGKGRQRGGV